MEAADQPITAVENGDPDPDVILYSPPPAKEVNGLISETVKEEDQEIIIEEIKSVDPEGEDDREEHASEVIVKKEEESLDLVAPVDHEYSAVAFSEGEPEAVAVAVKEEEEEDVEAASLVVKEQLEEEKSTEAELPVSLDRAVGENVESVQCSGGTEIADENQPSGVITTNQLVHHSSLKDCCGLFDVLRRRSNQ